MRIEMPASCTENPVVTVENTSDLAANQVVNTASVHLAPNGLLTYRMGLDQGSATVTVSACGATTSMLIYNYGKAPVPGLPAGFPQDITAGDYVMTWSGGVAGQCCDPGAGCQNFSTSFPTTSGGTFAMINLKTFATVLEDAFNRAIASVNTPGCSQSVAYSPFTGSSFSVTYTLNCATPGCTSTATFTFTLQKK